MTRSRFARLGALAAFLGCLCLAGSALADAPSAVQIQGVMSTAGGAPVSDGKYSLTFSLYNSQTGGIALWTEVIPSVTVTGGRFESALVRSALKVRPWETRMPVPASR